MSLPRVGSTARCWRRWNMILRQCAALATLLGLLSAIPALAAGAAAEVEAVQMPAWLVRDSQRAALAPGTVLRNGDQVETGAGSRVLLRLGDGSMVKLGESARFKLDGTGLARDDAPFSARMWVLAGAFRFTTTDVYGFSGRRQIEVRFPTVTARVTGTDLWGKAGVDREIVALIQGRVSVARAGTPPVDLSKPGSVYQALVNAGVLPVEAASEQTLAAYAAETEIAPGQGAASRNGKWRVYAARTTVQEDAQAVYERLLAAGYAAAIQPLQQDGTTVYQVRIPGLLSEADGVALAIRLRSELGLQDVSVSST
jgi:hypothetical protein